MSDADRDDDRRTGLPDIDAFIDVADAERGTLNDLFAVNAAENAVVAIRRDELVAEQTAAHRRWSAAKGRLTRAQRDGDAGKIAAARRRVDELSAECDRNDKRITAELARLSQARHDQVGEIYDQMHRSWDAGGRVIDALEGHRVDRRHDDG
ncbi:hypothetical protein Franean1_4760 [Parafrankia sp. EAN1pec]|uniref:hypothetical protein n=1 Tax=Parafrankia sp. (strain EAN1pec) TaxID=298653 RepID=UPI00005438D7|nr:hypothetical protein Franean1_4760 [Frankia sp. EAN1pec]